MSIENEDYHKQRGYCRHCSLATLDMICLDLVCSQSLVIASESIVVSSLVAATNETQSPIVIGNCTFKQLCSVIKMG